MPIRPENRARYPANWKAISLRIRFERAGGRCECTGQCGVDHGGRCEAEHGKPHPVTGSTVVLTTMHLNHTPEDCRDEVLMAGCQGCHNRYDAPLRAAGIAARREAERRRVLEKAGQLAFEVECLTGRPVARAPAIQRSEASKGHNHASDTQR